jgi:hypothetical protein
MYDLNEEYKISKMQMTTSAAFDNVLIIYISSTTCPPFLLVSCSDYCTNVAVNCIAVACKAFEVAHNAPDFKCS